MDGLLPGRREEATFELLPDALPAWRLWQAMQTQWRLGPAGVYGLDYAVLPVVEQRCGIEREEAGQLFACLQDMEREALRMMAKKGA
ncbi:hypothetical protein BI344_08610 [Chromobacterium sphagni]|uniref:DUF1799 domain-containing protein n=1 Tax=Chromobacterium sphagni TaxID=1903179 RepID=A0ABX3CEU4_9NEIS|nr:hypothetical protein BI344_08610 [Chromobacterium sphagni]